MIYLHEYATCKFCAFCHLPIEKSLPCKVCTNDYHEECFDSHGCKSCKNCENGKCLSTMVLKGRNKIKVFKEEEDVTCSLNLLNIFANSENLENAYSIVKKKKENDIDCIVKKMTNYKGAFLHKEVKNKGCINKIVTYYTRDETFTYFWKKIYYVNNCKICNSNFHTSNKSMRICKECNACHSCGSMVDDCDGMFYMSKHIGQPTLRKLLYCKDCYNSYVLKDEICPICAKAYTQEEMLECDWCLRWIHYDCELNKDIIKAIDNDAFQDLYKCQVCIVFENYWLGKKAENVKTVLEPIAGEKKLAAKAIMTKGCKKPECYICVRTFNDEESKIIRLVKVMCGDTTKYAHNICALSHITSIVENRIMIDAKKMKCKRCHKPNATFKCVICKDDYYHFDCAFSDKNDLFRSNYLIPICETHLRRDIGIVNKLTKLYDTSDFFEIKKTKPSTIRINNYNLNSDGSFDVIVYLEQRTISLRCDFKNFYFDGAVSYQDEIVSKLQAMKTNINFPDAISNGIHLYNLHCKALNAPHFGNDRYNKCINSKFQQANYTSSHISSALSQKLSLYKEKSKIHGFGIFADRFCAPGDIIIAYEGCIINKQRANELEKEYSHLDHYLFKTNDKIIDATYMGNLAKYINQSCNPNCFSTQATWDNKKGILICAKKYITSGEEITYKYGFNGGKMQCNCNAYGCKKTLN